MLTIIVTVKSEGATRPSGHKLSPLFSGGIDYKETFTCSHSRTHADLFMKILDLSAKQCGTMREEFPSDEYFTEQMDRLVVEIEALHQYLKTGQKALP